VAWGRPPAGGVGHSTSRHAEISRTDIVTVSSEAGSITSPSDPASPLSQMVRPPHSARRPRPRSTCSPPCTPRNSGTRRSGQCRQPGRLICAPLRHGKAPDRPGPDRRPGAKSTVLRQVLQAAGGWGCPPTRRSDRPYAVRPQAGNRSAAGRHLVHGGVEDLPDRGVQLRGTARRSDGRTVPPAGPGRNSRSCSGPWPAARTPGRGYSRRTGRAPTGPAGRRRGRRAQGKGRCARSGCRRAALRQQWDQDRIVLAGQAGRLAQRVHAAR
jgi:hypothetical protein